MALLKSTQASWCLGTGLGTCNLNVEGTPVITEGGYKYVEMWTGINIFDHACNLLGHISRPVRGVSIYSELPWTIVMKEIQNDNRDFTFCYAGTCYSDGFTYNVFDEGGYSAIECLRAFDCDDEMRTAAVGRSRVWRSQWNESDFA